MSDKILKFPRSFLWGAATSAYQIEGGLVNDWSEWEKSPKRLEALKKADKNPEEFISGRAANSFELFDEDLKYIKELNLKAYRFSIDWSRVEPEEGKWSEEGINYYKYIIKKLRENDIEPFVTLWHWTNPLWLMKKGGWTGKRLPEYFGRYVGKIVEELGESVNFWITLNEPMMIIGHGYLDGKFPPNHKGDILNSLRLFKNFIAAHKTAYRIIHEKNAQAQVGLAMTTGYFDTFHKNNPLEKLIVKIADYLRNFWLLNRVRGFFDFLGVNYYHHDRLAWLPPFKRNENEEVSDFGWEIYPEGIYQVLKGYKKLNKPIYITENGIADADDDQRPAFIKNHLFYIHRALSEGVDVRGYLHWSLLDNFEWADGYSMKFGLVEVDRQTFKRTIRPSARAYAEICKNNALMID